MPIVFTLFTLLIALFPVLTIQDGLPAQSLFAAFAALIIAAAGVAARAADAQFAAQVTRRLGLAAAIPVAWMVIQLLPMPSQLSHTVWVNGNEVLDQKAWGHISVDLGKTLEALVFYLANIALILASILLARDYQRAGRLLIILSAVTFLTVLALLTDRVFHLFALSAYPQQGLGAASALGLVLSLAVGALGLERGAQAKRSSRTFLFASAGGIIICTAGLAAAANINLAVVAAFGAVTFLSIQLARSLQLNSWTIAVLLATLLAAATMIVIWRFDPDRPLSLLLNFATSTPTNSLAVAQRLLGDTGWFGAGAGTYTVLLPIYQDFGEAAVQLPSSAAVLVVVLGLPAVLIAVGIGLWLIVRLYGGALARGRDSFYAAAAASGTLILLGEAFCDTSLLQAGIAGTGSVLIGIGLAQSVSRVDKA